MIITVRQRVLVMSQASALDDISVVTQPSSANLNPRQRRDYRDQREKCLTWLLTFGKTPAKAEGYARTTVKTRAYRMDMFYRWVWKHEGGYTANVTHKHADGWMRALAQQDTSSTHKANCQKAVKMLMKWRKHEHGFGEWEHEISFSEDSSTHPRDFLTRTERTKIREATLEYGTVPSYGNLTPSERDRWKMLC
jgi:hypothetical protein